MGSTRQSIDLVSDKPAVSFDHNLCIIGQKSLKQLLISTDNGWRVIIDVATVRQYVVYECLKLVEQDLHCHVSNECYKQYSLKQILDQFKWENKASHPINSIQEESSTSEEPSINKLRWLWYISLYGTALYSGICTLNVTAWQLLFGSFPSLTCW